MQAWPAPGRRSPNPLLHAHIHSRTRDFVYGVFSSKHAQRPLLDTSPAEVIYVSSYSVRTTWAACMHTLDCLAKTSIWPTFMQYTVPRPTFARLCLCHATRRPFLKPAGTGPSTTSSQCVWPVCDFCPVMSSTSSASGVFSHLTLALKAQNLCSIPDCVMPALTL